MLTPQLEIPADGPWQLSFASVSTYMSFTTTPAWQAAIDCSSMMHVPQGTIFDSSTAEELQQQHQTLSARMLVHRIPCRSLWPASHRI